MRNVKLAVLLTLFLTILGCKTSKNATVDNTEGKTRVTHKDVIYELYCDSTQKEKVAKWTLDCLEQTRGKGVIVACSEEAERIICSYKKGILYTTNKTSYFLPCEELPKGSVDSALCDCE